MQRIRNVTIAANPGIIEHRIMVKVDAPATYRLLLYYDIGTEFNNSPKYWAVGKLTEFESVTHFFCKNIKSTNEGLEQSTDTAFHNRYRSILRVHRVIILALCFLA